jgi:hypothetical protein
MFKFFTASVVLCLLVMQGGCVSSEKEPQVKPARATIVSKIDPYTRKQTRLISWPSRVGYKYTIIYRDTRNKNPQMHPLEGASNIIGNGETIQFEDTSPRAMYRSYVPLTYPVK